MLFVNLLFTYKQVIMDTNNNDYVLVLEDRTAVKSEQEVGRLSVVTELASQDSGGS